MAVYEPAAVTVAQAGDRRRRPFAVVRLVAESVEHGVALTPTLFLPRDVRAPPRGDQCLAERDVCDYYSCCVCVCEPQIWLLETGRLRGHVPKREAWSEIVRAARGLRALEPPSAGAPACAAAPAPAPAPLVQQHSGAEPPPLHAGVAALLDEMRRFTDLLAHIRVRLEVSGVLEAAVAPPPLPPTGVPPPSSSRPGAEVPAAESRVRSPSASSLEAASSRGGSGGGGGDDDTPQPPPTSLAASDGSVGTRGGASSSSGGWAARLSRARAAVVANAARVGASVRVHAAAAMGALSKAVQEVGVSRAELAAYGAVVVELAAAAGRLDAWFSWAACGGPPPPGADDAWVAAHRAVFTEPSTCPGLAAAAAAATAFFREVAAPLLLGDLRMLGARLIAARTAARCFTLPIGAPLRALV